MDLGTNVIETAERKISIWYGQLNRMKDGRIPKAVAEWILKEEDRKENLETD